MTDQSDAPDQSNTVAGTPEVSAEDRNAVVDYLIDLRQDKIEEFLDGTPLPKTAPNQDAFRERIEQGLDDGVITIGQILAYLDDTEPWGRQHVFLYDVAAAAGARFATAADVDSLLSSHEDLAALVEAPLSLIHPDELTLSRVEITPGQRVVVRAVLGAHGRERVKSLNFEEERDGRLIEFEAFRHVKRRSIVRLDWDVVGNAAFLQVTELPGGVRYEDVERAFVDRTAPWLPFQQFSKLALHKAITKLQADEATSPKTTTQAFGLRHNGRNVTIDAGTSASVAGDPVIDSTITALRPTSIGRHGDFIWHDRAKTSTSALEAEVRTVLTSDDRIHFRRTSKVASDVLNVLSQIRAAAR